MIGTEDKLAAWRERVEQEPSAVAAELVAEVEYLTAMVVTVQAQRFFDRFHVFDGIRDDCCPACGGRVAVDETDPNRLRIISAQRARAS